MKTLITMVVILALMIATTSCGGTPKTMKSYSSYGIFNEDTNKSQKVCYKMSPMSVVLSIIFIETAIIPVYLVGWDLWDPFRMKTSPTDNCDLGR